MSMFTTWRSDEYHMLHMFHMHIEVRIKFSASEFVLFYFSESYCIYVFGNKVKNKILFR
jgi:hypothetical protein